jgi:uncharacterized protein YecE (DUF72 family)
MVPEMTHDHEIAAAAGSAAERAGQVRQLAGDADETHVVFNNCYRDYAHVNARQLAESLTPGARQGQ